MADRPGCFCCEVRTFLIVWCALRLIFGLAVIPELIQDHGVHIAYIILAGIGSIANFALNIFILIGAVKRLTKYLTISFYLVIVAFIYASAVIGVAAAFNEFSPQVSRLQVVFFGIAGTAVVDGLLAWTIRRTVNEIHEGDIGSTA